jgi:hypothetical protein
LDRLPGDEQERLRCLAITQRFAQIGQGAAQVGASRSFWPVGPQERRQLFAAVRPGPGHGKKD